MSRRTVWVTVGVLMLFAAGAATAAELASRIMLPPGQCVTVDKTKVCAETQHPRTTTRTAVSVKTVAATTVTNVLTVTAPPPPPKTAFGDGTFRVNVDIAPGTYQSDSNSGSCYWARLSGFDGSLGQIIANSFARQTIVTIAASDVGFESEHCGPWVKIG